MPRHHAEDDDQRRHRRASRRRGKPQPVGEAEWQAGSAEHVGVVIERRQRVAEVRQRAAVDQAITRDGGRSQRRQPDCRAQALAHDGDQQCEGIEFQRAPGIEQQV